MTHKLLKGGFVDDPLTAEKGRIEEPTPILDQVSQLSSWFVPVTLENRLVGYFRFLTDLSMQGYTTFQRKRSSISGCPPADSWLNAEHIIKKAREVAPEGDLLAPPFLTFDRHPSRLAWAVKFRDDFGKETTVFVAGEFAFLSSDAEEDTIG